jgi:nitrate reductase molybdenum cofactor assembly chaperone NarJ/NarW
MTGASRQPTLAWQAQSLLLAYPGDGLADRLDLLRDVAAAAGPRVGGPLLRFLDHAASTAPYELAAEYVATFDHRKRCCLFLTYYAYGDTRKRGMALLRLKQVYAAAGLRLADDELPDHLAVMLEFSAIAGPAAGRALLLEHRAGLELLRLALHDIASPWASVLDSVSATLPALRGDERQAVARLAAQGPPEEQVGLVPFAPPEYMPQPQDGPR